MEMVREYWIIQFRKVNAHNIDVENTERIVDRYLNGDNPQRIALEESKRMQREKMGNTLVKDIQKNIDSLDIHHTANKRTRPLPHDMNQLERNNEREKVHHAQKAMNKWRWLWMLSCMLVVATNVGIAIADVKGIKMNFPYGIIPILPMIACYLTYKWATENHREISQS